MNNCTLEGFREHYPAIFSRCRSFACGDGWFDLLDHLCKQITDAVEAGAPVVTAIQVKEKFGTLRFYVSGGDATTNALIDAAVAQSGSTCEQCGATSASMSALGGIYRVRCVRCYAALRKELGSHVFDFCSEEDIGPALLSHRQPVIEAFLNLYGDKVREKWTEIEPAQSQEMVRQVRGVLGTITAKIEAKKAAEK